MRALHPRLAAAKLESSDTERTSPGRSGPRFLLQGGIAVVLATMLAGIFEHNLGDSEILAMFLVVVASGYVALDGLPVIDPGTRPAAPSG